MKYLELYVAETLRWSTHVKQLPLQLARWAKFFYRIRNLVPKETLRMLYHSLVQYGISFWENAAKIQYTYERY